MKIEKQNNGNWMLTSDNPFWDAWLLDLSMASGFPRAAAINVSGGRSVELMASELARCIISCGAIKDLNIKARFEFLFNQAANGFDSAV